MKKVMIIIVSIFMGLCFMNNTRADEKTAADLVEYVNQGILNIGEMETKALEYYSSVTGDNYTTDEAVYNTMKNDVIPLYKRFYSALMGIRPNTEPVMKLHQIYVRGVRDINEGFNLKKIGLETKNDSIVEMANSKIEAGSEYVIEWKKKLLELCKEQGVAPRESKE